MRSRSKIAALVAVWILAGLGLDFGPPPCPPGRLCVPEPPPVTSCGWSGVGLPCRVAG